jgi:voltage-gated potassium channel Kch
MVRAWLERYRPLRFQILFGFLLLTLLASPLVRELGLGGYALEAGLLASLLVAGLGGLGLGRGRAVVVLVLLFVASRALQGVYGGAGVVTASDVFLTLAAVLAGVAALREVLREGVVTGERLYAAISVYMLAGLAFALIYHALSRIEPGALIVAGTPSAALDIETAIYFSFVTLATLGYGDVVPATAFARSLAICEAVGAQLFVAVLIARLVSLQSRSRE